jgi:hypothetical protein
MTDLGHVNEDYCDTPDKIHKSWPLGMLWQCTCGKVWRLTRYTYFLGGSERRWVESGSLKKQKEIRQ